MQTQPIVALIYDFDGTLSPGNMQEFGFIQAIRSTPKEFWEKSDGIAKGQDASNILAYMKLMFDEAKSHNIKLKRSNFNEFGRHVKLFEGVKEWFSLINDYGKSKGVVVEHYINSSGLKEIIEGTEIAHEFKHIFACTFLYDEEGKADWPGNVVDYSTKTQFIFKINKGIFSARDAVLVNDSTAEDEKRIPFPRMIYFGDGETDVPCMKIVKMFGGHPVAVYNPDIPNKKEVAEKLQLQGRVRYIAPAVYTQDSKVYKIVCRIIDKIRTNFELSELAK